MEPRADTKVTGPSRYEQIAREHAFVRERIEQIESELAALDAEPALAASDWVLPELARDLRRHLREHFRLEESGGLLGKAARYYDPGTGRRVEALIDQHRGFEGRLDALVDAIERADADSTDGRARIARDARALVDDLAHHEAAETALLQRLVTRDIGTGD